MDDLEDTSLEDFFGASEVEDEHKYTQVAPSLEVTQQEQRLVKVLAAAMAPVIQPLVSEVAAFANCVVGRRP